MPGDLIPPASPIVFIENTDTQTMSSPTAIYWTPPGGSSSGVDYTGEYFNVNSQTSEVLSNIEFTGQVSAITSYTVSVQYGILYYDGVPVPGNAYTFAVTSPTNTLFVSNLLSFAPGNTGSTPTIDISVYTHGSSNANNSVSYPVLCFAKGTRIACPDGMRMVEDLQPGDMVLNSHGLARPVCFIGQRMIDLSISPQNAPVLIPAGAIADNVPSHDLRLSPDHAVVMEGVLIPVRSLIGDVVVQQDVDQVTYYHIQLDSHDVVMAENTPCETLLNTDDPSLFDNADEAVISDAFLAPCLPRVTQGAQVEAARLHLRVRNLATV